MWTGNHIDELLKEPFRLKIEEHLQNLQKYENFPQKVTLLCQGEELSTPGFAALFSVNSKPGEKAKTFRVEPNHEIDYWYAIYSNQGTCWRTLPSRPLLPAPSAGKSVGGVMAPAPGPVDTLAVL